MGVKKLDQSETKFYEDKDIVLNKKQKALSELRDYLINAEDLSEKQFDEGVRKLHAYCEITERTHPEETRADPNTVVSGWANMRDGATLQ